jgi:hypothetical protein
MELLAPIDILNCGGDHSGTWKRHPEVWMVVSGRRIIAAQRRENGVTVERWLEGHGPVDESYGTRVPEAS